MRRNFVVDAHEVHLDVRVAVVLFHFGGNARHRFDRFDRIVAVGRLAAEHNCVDSLVNRVGHVADLGPGGARIADHRVEHLCGDDDRDFAFDAFVDQKALCAGNPFGRDFHPQVTAGHHDAVGFVQDFVDVVHAFLVLDLRNDLDRTVAFLDDLFYRKHILFFADERMGDKVDIHVDGPVDEFEVTLGHRRQVDGDIGYEFTLLRGLMTPLFLTRQISSSSFFSVTSISVRHRRSRWRPLPEHLCKSKSR